ncbi:hypothetical protein N0B44_06040 [Roseibacterium beibuensis]|uniref:ATP-binding protein n=1 Tax=[Roseibacterium] beibuensis TaxID=1193142 RepID=A0ABP9KUA3_9RHOB|nr:hypothetical protein [Roseibacterium beibuensis]MCS6622466.1 hypothetical protein [Roseibacterium beibuensis]
MSNSKRSENFIASHSLALLRKFTKPRRNEIRGAISHIRQKGITTRSEDIIRCNTCVADMAVAASLLEGPYGLKGRTVTGLSQKDVWLGYETQDRDFELELAYLCGFLNSWPEETAKAIGTIEIISGIWNADHLDAAGALLACANEWGASNYLAFKIAYLKHVSTGDDKTLSVLNKIDSIVEHRESPQLQFSAMEHMKESLSIFSIARRHTNTLRQMYAGNFRRSLSLSNLVSTPFSNADGAAFIHRAVESSLFDGVHVLWILWGLQDRFPSLERIAKRILNDDILRQLELARTRLGASTIPDLKNKLRSIDEQDRSLEYYKKSSAFLEFPALARFRNDIDRVIGYRFVIALLPNGTDWPTNPYCNLNNLMQPNSTFDLALHNHETIQIDTFYRTYLFLRYIQDKGQLALLNEYEVKYLFNNTVGLDSLLTEAELQTMHMNASEETRALVSVLALALFRGRSSDPDVDFEYRLKLEDYIIDEFDGKIPDFIEDLTLENPQIASYLSSSLDESTLQKMYRLINSAQQAGEVRKQILTSVGLALNRIDYIIEAEAIETRAKVSGLRKYFDGSRMFVDSVAMSDWLAANPSAYTQHYKELLPQLVTRLTAIADYKDTRTGETHRIPVVEVSNTIDHIVKQIVQEAFREFCTNAEFGIESYLGRRIRHNTLHGVMLDPVDAVIAKPLFHPLLTQTRFGEAISDWKSSYRIYIDRMRKEFLQFKRDGKPSALFDPELDFRESATKRSIENLTQILKISGPEMLPDLVIAFCWEQISPQLDNASREIRIKMSGDVKQSLEALAGKFTAPEQQRVLLELNEAIDTVFSRVASWFRRPDTGFVAASLHDICRIIDMEIGRAESPSIVTGNRLETKYYGISVHRIYDCLAVVLQNAVRHGTFHEDIKIAAISNPIEGTNLHHLKISVISKIDTEEVESSIERIQAALDAAETGRDMVTEGYSGLKKLKYLTKLNLGESSVDFASVGDEVEISFSLKVEISSEEASCGESSSD